MDIVFIQGNIHKSVRMENGTTLLSAALSAGLNMEADCAGAGTCGKCKIRILSDVPGTPDAAERQFFTAQELQDGWRLGCRYRPETDLIVEVPTAFLGSDRKKQMVRLPAWFSGNECFEAECQAQDFGFAFDIGTTTVVGMLWDKRRAELLDAVSRRNPQSIHGADVISRILFTIQEEDGLKVLQSEIRNCLLDITAELTEKNELKAECVGEAVVVGNTTMMHLFLGITPESLSRAPFSPRYTGAVTLTAPEVFGSVMSEDSFVTVLPNIAGHVGADLTGVLLATSLDRLSGSNLAIDIGTNGEILAGANGRILACSTAAGPAFEGASIKCGMRAENGAIEAVRIEDGEVTLTVIGESEPVGLCGSGLIDGVAVLFSCGLLSETGKLMNPEEAIGKGICPSLAKRLRREKGGTEFVVSKGTNPVVITQKDIREVQLAKGAILAGITILLKELNITAAELDKIFLAGAFGNYIDKKSALTIGLLPAVPLSKVVSIGNAAGVGASMALLSTRELARANELVKEIEHVELSSHPDFQTVFLASMAIGGKE